MVEIRNIVIMVQEGATKVESYRIPAALRGDILNARHCVHELAKAFPFFRGSSVEAKDNEIILEISMERSVYNGFERKWKAVKATREELEAFVNYMAENVPIPLEATTRSQA